jgi:hypothetical protein
LPKSTSSTFCKSVFKEGLVVQPEPNYAQPICWEGTPVLTLDGCALGKMILVLIREGKKAPVLKMG